MLENKYFSLLINESIDVSIVEALCIIVWYVSNIYIWFDQDLRWHYKKIIYKCITYRYITEM